MGFRAIKMDILQKKCKNVDFTEQSTIICIIFVSKIKFKTVKLCWYSSNSIISNVLRMRLH